MEKREPANSLMDKCATALQNNLFRTTAGIRTLTTVFCACIREQLFEKPVSQRHQHCIEALATLMLWIIGPTWDMSIECSSEDDAVEMCHMHLFRVDDGLAIPCASALSPNSKMILQSLLKEKNAFVRTRSKKTVFTHFFANDCITAEDKRCFLLYFLTFALAVKDQDHQRYVTMKMMLVEVVSRLSRGYVPACGMGASSDATRAVFRDACAYLNNMVQYEFYALAMLPLMSQEKPLRATEVTLTSCWKHASQVRVQTGGWNDLL